jgi:hypothetical protein
LPVNLGTPTQAASVFSFSGDFEMGDITIGGSISVQSIFANSLIRKVGNVNFSSATTVATLFNSCYNLIEVGNVNISSATTTTNTFTGCHKLIKVGEINNTASTNIQAMFSGCSYIKQISFTNLSNVSSATTSLFNACYSLQSLRVPGLKVTFTLIDTAMERPALVQVFNDLGTPATTQIVTVTRTPGSADLTAADILIATGKNWTVTL